MNNTTCEEKASLPRSASILVLRRVWRPNVRPSHPLEFIVVEIAVVVAAGVHILSYCYCYYYDYYYHYHYYYYYYYDRMWTPVFTTTMNSRDAMV